jgi:hypothetical protein
MWPNPLIGSFPLTTWLIFCWFALACINTHNKDVWRAQLSGDLSPGDEAPPDWLVWLIYPQYAILGSLFLFDGEFVRAVSVFVVTFIIAVFLRPIMVVAGAVLLAPLRFAQVKLRSRAQERV